jgi:CRP-like cAMP-binding protein
VLGPGDVFGEAAFVTRRLSSETVVARKETTVKLLEENFLAVLWEICPELGGKFFYHLSCVLGARLTDLENAAEDGGGGGGGKE